MKHVCDKDIGYYKCSKSNLCQYEKWAESSITNKLHFFKEGYEVLILLKQNQKVDWIFKKLFQLLFGENVEMRFQENTYIYSTSSTIY